MPKASSLIQRNVNGSQESSTSQLWVISARDGTTYNIGFDKEFVKKHLFVDPDPPVSLQDKATHLVERINTYGHLSETVPTTVDSATLRFLKLKKLVLSRTVQGTCSVCHDPETQHDQICANCGHKHKKPWTGGGACNSVADPTCTCSTWQMSRGGISGKCTGFVTNEYDQHRSSKGKPNPFGGSGGACTGTNTVVLMDEIDVQDFKDVVAAAITAQKGLGWTPGQRIDGEGLSLAFGAGTVATIEGGDSFTTFNSRAKARGIKVHARRDTGSEVYRIYHYHGQIA